MNHTGICGPSFLQCPKCGALATVYRNSIGNLKATCQTPGCGNEMLWANQGRRHRLIEYHKKMTPSSSKIVVVSEYCEFSKNKIKKQVSGDCRGEMKQAL